MRTMAATTSESMAAVRLAAICAVVALPVGAVEGQTPGYDPVVRVAFMTFDSPGNVAAKPDYQTIRSYLQSISDRSRTDRRFRHEVDFEIVVGNYYQVFSWLRSGAIDGAVCSAFIAQLLEAQRQGEVLAEFAEAPDGRGYRAVSILKQGDYDALLAKLWNHGDLPGRLEDVELNMVAHLSSSGFIAPLLYADRWVVSAHKGAPEAEPAAFWSQFFRHATFRLRHGSESPFTYDKPGAPGAPYPLTRAGGARELFIPYDALVMRPALAAQLFDDGHPDSEGENPWLSPKDFVPAAASIYQHVRPADRSARKAFADRLEEFQKDNGMDERFRDWFERDGYDFTPEETKQILRNDALDTGRDDLALVLSGGGVKSAYQSRLLDLMYEKHYLVNAANQASAPAGTLTVQHVIGTSGGAIVGVFAAQVEPGDVDALSAEWVRGSEVVASADDVFARWDLLRWISLWMVLSVLALCLACCPAPNRAPRLRAGLGPLPRWASVGLGSLVVLVPIVVSLGMRRRESTLLIEGVLYVAVVLGVHGLWYCTYSKGPSVESKSSSRDPVEWTMLTLAVLLGIAGASGLVGFQAGDDSADKTSRAVVAILLALILALSWAFRRAASGKGNHVLVDAGLHARAVALSLAFCLTTFLASWALFAVTGLGTTLELTPEYWTGLVVVALALAILIAREAHRRPASVIGRAVAYMTAPREVGVIRASPLSALVVLLGAGGLSWVVVVSTAAYGNEVALQLLTTRLQEGVRRRGGADGAAPQLQADLIVATSALNSPRLFPPDQNVAWRSGVELPAGGWFFCFPARDKDTCGDFADGFTVRDPKIGDFENLVFASGSPFPIFPAHRVRVDVERRGTQQTFERSTFRGSLIDGGYAHQEGISAAADGLARQVLIVRATPAESTRPGRLGWLLSPLSRNLPRLFNFMFAQSQGVDRGRERDLVVASLTPHADNPAFPFLMDFRPKQVKLVDGAASADFNLRRRIGRIEGWGQPLYFDSVRGVAPHDRQPGPGRGWNVDVKTALADGLRTAPTKTAVFDLDGTCIQADIGEAVFEALARKSLYRGDLDDFWSLFDDDLRGPGRVAFANRKGDDALRLFASQYERLRKRNRDSSQAYGWLVRLLGGLGEGDVEALTREVLAEQARRPEGVHVYAEMKDLIRRLQDLGWSVWIVSASNEYSVRAVASSLAIPADHVVGGRLRPAPGNPGRLGFDLAAPLPYRLEKARVLTARKLEPSLVAGDSMGDFEMLKASRGISLVIDHGAIPRQDAGPSWIFQPQAKLTPLP
jgi:phosphoserine phosphatase